jgi:hypothetical protein
MNSHQIARRILIALTIFLCGNLALAASPKNWKTECTGYYTLQLPGDIEYALGDFKKLPSPLIPLGAQFADGISGWDVFIDVRTELIPAEIKTNTFIQIYVTSNVTDLKDLWDRKNSTQQKIKDDFLDLAKRIEDDLAFAKDIDPDGRERRAQRTSAAQVPFYQSIPDRSAFGLVGIENNPNTQLSGTVDNTATMLNFSVLINNHIISAKRKLIGTPQQTLDAFLSHYKARAPFEVPSGPGVCLPYALMTGEVAQANTATSMRLKDRPEIVINLKDVKEDQGLKTFKDPAILLMRRLETAQAFYAAKTIEPLDGLLRKTHHTTIDGRKGVASFVAITRQSDTALADNAKDWGYMAVIPADKTAAPGQSSDLILRIERYGKLAKQPMKEKEFRELVKNITASIKRRPGAWAAPS